MTGDGPPAGRVGSERDAAVVALRDLILAGESFRTAVASRFGIGVRESEAISYLRASGPMTPVELAAALHLTSGTVTNLLDRLERADLARREHHPTDGRRMLVRLTERAHCLADTTRSWMAECVEGLDDVGAARGVLEALARELRSRITELA